MMFSHPGYLLLLFLLPLCLIALKMWWARSVKRLRTLSRHAESISPRVKVQSGLLLLAMACLIVALAEPRWGKSEETMVLHSRNVMLAVDVSRSMLAEDVYPNRLGRAKADLTDLVTALKDDRAGLLAFRGKGALLCPMTSDRAFLCQSIAALEPDMAPPGETDLADAIQKCLEVFDAAQSSHHAIILISDGEDLAGRAQRMAERAGERGIPIFTVGIGSTQGAEIRDGGEVVKHEGKVVKSCLTETTLRAIAEASGGHYIPLATAGTAQTTLGAVYTRYLSRLADEETRERLETRFTDRSALFALFSALFAVAAGCLSVGRIGRLNCLFVATFFLVPLLSAQEPARDAQRHYRKANYAEAAEAYAVARLGAEPSEAAHYAYNEALALWKMGDVTNAVACVKTAVAVPEFTARASTLEGVLHMALSESAADAETRLTHRTAAVEAFSRSLRAEPSDVAERNLTRALSDLERLRSEARKAAALKRYQTMPFPQQIGQLLQQQRALMKAVPEVFNIRLPVARLQQAERLAADVTEQSDRWFPIAETLPQVVTNETLCVQLQQGVQHAQSVLDAAAQRYEAVEPEMNALPEGEPFVYNFWKLIAQPNQLIDEAIAVQTNALTSVYRYQPARDDETEVLSLVQQFRVMFPNWAEELLRQQAASTNEVSFTEAARDEIARTADATVPLLTPPVSDENKQRVMDNLNKIRDLLPKKQNQPSESSPQAQPQGQGENDADRKHEPPPEAGENEEEKEAPQPSSEENAPEKEELNAMLQKAVDREREHEEEKRKRAYQQVSPNQRDW